jgi:hypothetical protein
LWECAGVRDITPLAICTDLEYLDLDGTSVSDLTPLSGLSKLGTLWLRDCDTVTDLTPLADLSNLEYLHIEGIAPDTDISPLAANKRLKVTVYKSQDVRNIDSIGKRIKFERE